MPYRNTTLIHYFAGLFPVEKMPFLEIFRPVFFLSGDKSGGAKGFFRTKKAPSVAREKALVASGSFLRFAGGGSGGGKIRANFGVRKCLCPGSEIPGRVLLQPCCTSCCSNSPSNLQNRPQISDIVQLSEAPGLGTVLPIWAFFPVQGVFGTKTDPIFCKKAYHGFFNFCVQERRKKFSRSLFPYPPEGVAATLIFFTFPCPRGIVGGVSLIGKVPVA